MFAYNDKLFGGNFKITGGDFALNNYIFWKIVGGVFST